MVYGGSQPGVGHISASRTSECAEFGNQRAQYYPQISQKEKPAVGVLFYDVNNHTKHIGNSSITVDI